MTAPVLAVDPGVLSGLVWAERGQAGMVDIERWAELDQQATCDEIVNWCVEGAGARDGRVLIIERFIPRGGAVHFQPASLEIIGVTRWAARKSGVRLVTQAAGDMKRIRSVAVARWPEVGRGGKGHAKDALGHLYLFA